MSSTGAIILIIVSLCVLIFAVYKLVGINSFQKSINEQSEQEIEAVKNIDWSQLRSEKSMKDLQNCLMLHIEPRLKSPISAVICPAEKMSISSPDDKGKFKISGYVDSQNGFGAMKRGNFNATAHYNPNSNTWIVEKVYLFET